MADFWIFGYGSLMWRPGFIFEEAMPARLWGWHRALCIWSTVYRGTPEAPGLVLGLAAGGSCRGMAFRVSEAEQAEAHAYLRARELISDVYREVFARIRLDDAAGTEVHALTYVANSGHPQVAASLDAETRLAIVARGHGSAGSNVDYVVSTHETLARMGMPDPALARFVRRLGRPHEG